MNNCRFEKHIFVCINERASDHPRGSCGEETGRAIASKMKSLIKSHNLQHKVRAQRSSCMDICEWGPNMVVYPEGVFYSQLHPDDVKEIFEEHILNGRPVRRLMSDFSKPPVDGG